MNTLNYLSVPSLSLSPSNMKCIENVCVTQFTANAHIHWLCECFWSVDVMSNGWLCALTEFHLPFCAKSFSILFSSKPNSNIISAQYPPNQTTHINPKYSVTLYFYPEIPIVNPFDFLPLSLSLSPPQSLSLFSLSLSLSIFRIQNSFPLNSIPFFFVI